MKFFVPAAEDDAQAERVYQSIAKHIGARSNQPRISSLSWDHNGMSMSAEVGRPLPVYYGTGAEPVVAIFDIGDCYAICTETRGVIEGGPVYAGKGEGTVSQRFE